MTTWIKRSEQEPPKDGTWVSFFQFGSCGEPQYLSASFQNKFWRDAAGDSWLDDLCDHWPFWMPLPDPPPRMVTIEISEEDALNIVLCGANGRQTGSPWRGVVRACAAALKKEGK